MINCPIKMDRRKVAKARRRIARGVYDAPEMIDAVADLIVADNSSRGLEQALNTCATGDGASYRDLTARVFVKAFGGAVDLPFLRREFPLAGGRGDIEIPFKIEAVGGQCKLAQWFGRFDMRSILVEVKNEEDAGPVNHVRQIADDVASSLLGRVGFLVCRNGLTKSAEERLRQVNHNREMLILPFDHAELVYLASLRKGRIDEHLHRKEITTLRRAS